MSSGVNGTEHVRLIAMAVHAQTEGSERVTSFPRTDLPAPRRGPACDKAERDRDNHPQTSRQGVNITTRDMDGSMDMKEASLTDAWASLRPVGCTTPGAPPPAPGPTFPRKVLRLGLCTGLAILATTGRRARSGDLSAAGDSPADPRMAQRRTRLQAGESVTARAPSSPRLTADTYTTRATAHPRPQLSTTERHDHD